MITEIPLIENFPLETPGQIVYAPWVIWGLLSLEKNCRLSEDTRYQQDLLTSVRIKTRHCVFVYVNSVGWDQSSRALANLGVINNLKEVEDVFDGNFSNATPKQPVIQVPHVGLAGRIRAGKELAGNILASRYQGVMLEFADALTAYALAMGFQPIINRSEMRKVNDIIKPTFGDDTFAVCTYERANHLAQRFHFSSIFTGGYRPEREARLALAQPLSDLVEIYASPETRYQRSIDDKGKPGQNSKSREQFDADDEAEFQKFFSHVFPLCTRRFNNDFQDEGKQLEDALISFYEQIFWSWGINGKSSPRPTIPI